MKAQQSTSTCGFGEATLYSAKDETLNGLCSVEDLYRRYFLPEIVAGLVTVCDDLKRQQQTGDRWVADDR